MDLIRLQDGPDAEQAGSSSGRDSVPAPQLIAYRGLWDKFAAPGTIGALRRAYVRGVPSLVRVGDGEPDLAEVMALLLDPAVNPRRRAIYLVTPEAPADDLVARHLAAGLQVFLVRAGVRDDVAWPMCRRDGSAWSPAGLYLPARAVRKGLSVRDLEAAGTRSPTPAILCESLNVIDTIAVRSRFGGFSDLATLRSIRAIVGPQAVLARVSDMVELDQLDQQTREVM